MTGRELARSTIPEASLNEMLPLKRAVPVLHCTTGIFHSEQS